MDFSQTFAASDLKSSRYRHLIEYMKVCEYKRLRSFLDLSQRLAEGHVHTKIQTGFSQKLLCRSEPNCYESFQVEVTPDDMMLVT